MTLFEQIFWGSMYLGVCLILQILFLTLSEYSLSKVHPKLQNNSRFWHVMVIFVLALVFIVSSHTAQIWIWALVYVLNDVLPDWNSALYFSLVTYTSLGYGDIVLGPAVRVFAGFAAVTGMLGFGISIAYLVALMGRLPRDHEP